MNDYNDDLATVSKSSLFDSSNPNDDIWRKFSLPLTPPRSPSRSLGETSECNDLVDDIADRLQDVCDSLDSAFYVPSKIDTTSLRSKLISDCMWGSHFVKVKNRTISSITTVPQKKSTIETEEDLYPTPCASPLPTVICETTDYPTSNECVNPITVFPLTPQDNLCMLSAGQSDTGKRFLL